jgi:hypothetical protein
MAITVISSLLTTLMIPWAIGQILALILLGISLWWLLLTELLTFLFALAMFLTDAGAGDKLYKYYNYIQRGIVLQVDPEKPRAYFDGYTHADIRLQQWRPVKPSTWRTLEEGDVIDFT